MTRTQPHWAVVWPVFFGCLFVGNAVLSFKLLSRIDAMEQRTASIAAHTEALAQQSAASQQAQPFAPAVSRVPGSGAVLPADILQQIQNIKRTGIASPADAAAKLDEKMTREIANPALEQKQVQWLGSSLDHMPPDAPKASDVRTSCKGRRCMVSAEFPDDDAARIWATQYVLSAGGKLLNRSETIVIPLNATGSAVGLQLYFH